MFTLVITRVSQTYLSMKPTFLNETFGCTWSSLLHAGFLYLLWTRAFHCSGSSCWGAQALGARTSGVAACGPRVVACGCSCSMACESSQPGTEPVSPALAGGFLTTVPLAKSQISFLKMEHLFTSWGISIPKYSFQKTLVLF